ncbi:MAG: hypothetical protein ACXW1Y_04250 [Acidimicrobiia bacterium]
MGKQRAHWAVTVGRDLELAHAQPMAPPYVLVEVRAPGRHSLDDAKRFLSRRLWERDLKSPEFPTSASLHEWHERKTREFEATPEPPRQPQSITVTDRPHHFEARTEGDHWAAVGTLGETVVAIEVGGLVPDQVSLVTIEDLAPYVEGSIAQVSRWRRPPTE